MSLKCLSAIACVRFQDRLSFDDLNDDLRALIHDCRPPATHNDFVKIVEKGKRGPSWRARIDFWCSRDVLYRRWLGYILRDRYVLRGKSTRKKQLLRIYVRRAPQLFHIEIENKLTRFEIPFEPYNLTTVAILDPAVALERLEREEMLCAYVNTRWTEVDLKRLARIRGHHIEFRDYATYLRHGLYDELLADPHLVVRRLVAAVLDSKEARHLPFLDRIPIHRTLKFIVMPKESNDVCVQGLQQLARRGVLDVETCLFYARWPWYQSLLRSLTFDRARLRSLFEERVFKLHGVYNVPNNETHLAVCAVARLLDRSLDRVSDLIPVHDLKTVTRWVQWQYRV